MKKCLESRCRFQSFPSPNCIFVKQKKSNKKQRIIVMTLDFYYLPMSGCCRAVMLTAEAVGVTLNYKIVNIMEGEHLTPEYEQLNPQKLIPVLVDGDYTLTESRAIMAYLVDQYGDNERLYPTSPEGRATVNQYLHFDIGTLYKNVSQYYFPVIFRGAQEYNQAAYENLEESFDILDRYIDNQDYVTGRNITIADLALIATVTTAEACGFDVTKYENVDKWAERVKSSAPGYRTANGDGVEIFRKFAAGVKTE